MATGERDVAVNLLWCVPGRVGGSEQYLVRQLTGLAEVRALAPLRNDLSLTLYCLSTFAAAHPELADLYELDVVDFDGENRARRVWSEHTWLARRTRGAALVHHGGGTAPMIGARPVVLTIHDLQHVTHPEYLSPYKLRYLRAMIPRSVRRASVVAVPTEYVRGTVIDAYDVDPRRVVVVPHGVEPTIADDAPTEDELRAKYDLGAGPVLVFPAMTHPHKGHEFLLDVMAQCWLDPRLRLVLLGGVGAVEGAVGAQIERLGLGDRVVRTGRVPDVDRDGLVALAAALVFPSEYEGFGAPVVEAMALGTPVICADQPALREVVNGAGIVLPRTIESWADALDRLDERSSEMIVAGRARAQDFTLRASGSALLSTYEQALEQAR